MSKEEFKVTHTINIPRETISCAKCKRYGEQTCVPYGLSCQYEPIIPHGTVRISQKHINNINKIVKELQKENQELKKQLEEYKRLGFKHLNDKCNKLENQQKEFIEWLINEANINPYDISDYIYEDIINAILSKYNGIIGSDSK